MTDFYTQSLQRSVGEACLEMDRLRGALCEIVEEADQSNGGKGAQLSIVRRIREIAMNALRRP